MIGIAPATAASKYRSTLLFAAASKSSPPCCASKALFAVTTDLPEFSAARIRVLAGSIPPMTSMMTSMAGSLTTALASAVTNTPDFTNGSSSGRAFLASLTATDFKTRFVPARAARSSWPATSCAATLLPTEPAPSRPIANERFAGSFPTV